MRYLALAAIVVLAALVILAAAARTAQRSPAVREIQPAALIDQELRAAVERNDVPGIVAMAADRRGIIYQGAFGLADVGRRQPMTTDAIFRIASMTKPVTSVAAMQLVEQGRIALDDPVANYLTELANLSVFESFDSGRGAYKVRPVSKRLTIRHLLTHTSGLGYDFTSAIVRDFKPRAGDEFAAGPLLFEPGSEWHYGTSIDWVGRLVESISGVTLDEYFRSHIFRPLGMSDTQFNVPDDKLGRLPTIHQRLPGGALVEEPRATPRPVTRFNGGGGLSSTAGDYMRFLQMFLNGGEQNGARILSAQTVESMGRNQIGDVSARALKTAVPQRSSDFTFIADRRDKWGLGFLITSDHVAGKRSAGSLSWGGIYNTYFWIDRNRTVAGVIMMQMLPFADDKALKVYDAFERGVYRLIDTSTTKTAGR